MLQVVYETLHNLLRAFPNPAFSSSKPARTWLSKVSWDLLIFRPLVEKKALFIGYQRGASGREGASPPHKRELKHGTQGYWGSCLAHRVGARHDRSEASFCPPGGSSLPKFALIRIIPIEHRSVLRSITVFLWKFTVYRFILYRILDFILNYEILFLMNIHN
jgi:hypothetical protein